MRRWQRGENTIERLLAGGELQAVSGAAANGEPWLAKARRTLTTATSAVAADPDSAFTLSYDAARFACTALLTQQGLRATTSGGHYAVEVAVRDQFGDKFDQFGAMRRQRNDIEYPVIVAGPLTTSDAPESRYARAYLPWSQFGESYHRQSRYHWPVYLSVITVRFVMAHLVAAATGKDQGSEKVHTLRS